MGIVGNVSDFGCWGFFGWLRYKLFFFFLKVDIFGFVFLYLVWFYGCVDWFVWVVWLMGKNC